MFYCYYTLITALLCSFASDYKTECNATSFRHFKTAWYKVNYYIKKSNYKQLANLVLINFNKSHTLPHFITTENPKFNEKFKLTEALVSHSEHLS